MLYNGGKNPYSLIITPTGQMYKIGKDLTAENGGEISTADVDDPWFAVRDIYDRNCYINKEGEIVLRVSYSQCKNIFTELKTFRYKILKLALNLRVRMQ